MYVVGHKNPDTDSICTAIAYANLKTKITGETYEPRRAGQLNEETQYVLEHFGVKVPLLLSDLREQIKNVELKESQEIQGSLSIRTAWEKMSEMNTHTIPITRNGVLEGVITKVILRNPIWKSMITQCLRRQEHSTVILQRQ